MTYRDAKSWIDEHSGADEEERERRELVVHTSDDQCTVGDDGRCSACGASHGAPCPGCGGRAYHRPGCVYGEAVELVDQVAARRQRIATINAEIAAQHDVGPPALMLFDLVAGVDLELAGTAAAAVIDAVVPPVPADLERRTLAAVHRAELDPLLPAACPCGFPTTRSIHAGGELCPRGEVTAIAPVELEADAAELEAAELEAATVHGFGHPDVTMTSQVTISSPPLEPHAGPSVELRVFVRPRDQRRPRLVASHLHELAAAVYRATWEAPWPVAIVVAGDDRLPSGYVGRVRLELDKERERAAALALVRAMPELGGRPW